jgi:transcriptional regulator with XRE-family HTH domain
LELSQELLARLTGIGVATISRWERGRLLQNRALDNFLRVFFVVPEARRVLQATQQDPTLGTTVKANPSESSSIRPVQRFSSEEHDAIVEAFRKVDSRIQTCHRPNGAKPSEGYTHIHGPSRRPTPPRCVGHPLVVERVNGWVGFREPLGKRLNAVKRHDARIQQDPLGYSHVSIGGHKYVLIPSTILERWGSFENFAREVIKECQELDIW